MSFRRTIRAARAAQRAAEEAAEREAQRHAERARLATLAAEMEAARRYAAMPEEELAQIRRFLDMVAEEQAHIVVRHCGPRHLDPECRVACRWSPSPDAFVLAVYADHGARPFERYVAGRHILRGLPADIRADDVAAYLERAFRDAWRAQATEHSRELALRNMRAPPQTQHPALRRLYEELEQLQRAGAPAGTIHRLGRYIEAETRRHTEPMMVEAPNMTATQVGVAIEEYARSVDLRPGAINWVDEQQMLQLQREATHAEARTLEDLRTADARGLTLLKQWLTPEQLAQYERDQAFEVTGSKSKRRYRIRHGTVQNVYRLDASGNEEMGLCFAPEGGLVPGDVMLAQKVALETNEPAVLKVANEFGGMAYLPPEALRGFLAGGLGWLRWLGE